MKKTKVDCADETEIKPLNVSQDEIDAIRDAYIGQEKVPAGFRTLKEWVKIWGRSERQTSRALSELTRAGKFERRMFKTLLVDLRAFPLPYWRMIRK